MFFPPAAVRRHVWDADASTHCETAPREMSEPPVLSFTIFMLGRYCVRGKWKGSASQKIGYYSFFRPICGDDMHITSISDPGGAFQFIIL